MIRSPRLKTFAATAALAGAGALVATVTCVPEHPARAIPVFDASNYSKNLLTAARSLQQINNQIRSLQNQATSLLNQARNLSRIDFPELGQLTGTLQRIDGLMGQAQGIQFRVDGLDDQFRRLFPAGSDASAGGRAQAEAARARLETEMDAYRQTMTVQSQVVENVEADARTLGAVIARSQGAEGALQATQATNQLLALSAKQQFQIQQMMAAQYRADAVERAGRAKARADARAATTRFLGSGSAYTPQ